MEKQVYDKLTSEDKELLATIYDSKLIKTIARAGDIYQQDKAAHISLLAPDFNNVLLNRGNIQGARFIYDICKYAHTQNKKNKA